MSIAPIETVLQQMRALAATRDPQDAFAAAGGSASAASFSGALRQSLDRISQSQQHAYAQAEAFELGAPGVALNDVMVDLQKAHIGLQMGLQVRNRVVAAYQEVMNMQG